MRVNHPAGKLRTERLDGRLFLTEENLDRGALTLLAAARQLEVRLQNALSDHSISATELSILTTLSHEPGLGVAELRTRIGSTVPTTARLIAGLEKKGWIERPPAKGDGRRRALKLSDDGQDLINIAMTSIRKDLIRVYRHSGEPSVTGALELLASITDLSGETDKV